MPGRAERLHEILRAAMPDADIRVNDDSAAHAGHGGARAGGQTHFAVDVVWPGFVGQSRVDRSRRVHSLLHQEFAGGLHALELRLSAPGETK